MSAKSTIIEPYLIAVHKIFTITFGKTFFPNEKVF